MSRWDLDVDEVIHMEDGEQAFFFFAAQETDSRFDRPSRASLNEQASPNDHYIVIKKTIIILDTTLPDMETTDALL